MIHFLYLRCSAMFLKPIEVLNSKLFFVTIRSLPFCSINIYIGSGFVDKLLTEMKRNVFDGKTGKHSWMLSSER